MASIATYNFPDHIKGDTFSGVQFEVLVNAVPLDLTDAVITMHLKESYQAKAKEEFSTVNTKLEITDALAGKFAFKEQIVDICAKNYVYDIEILLPNAKKYTYIKGTWKINCDVTN
jgi:hypothetical protein